MNKDFAMKWIKKLTVTVAGIVLILTTFALAAGCDNKRWEEGKLKVAATTTMLTDLAKNIGGDSVSVVGIMNTGIDPHSYTPKIGDSSVLQKADVIVYSGLHLEGKMTDLLDKLSNGSRAVSVGNKIKEEDATLLIVEEKGIYDPHIWFDTALWSKAAEYVAEAFVAADGANADKYNANLTAYLAELTELDSYIKGRAAELGEGGRVLITAHDAFGYFARAYGFRVKGIQGISTDAEAATGHISALAEYISTNRIKAIFTESATSDKNIRSLQEAVRSRGWQVVIGGELLADSLGDAKSGTESYIDSFKHNIDTIVDALK